MEVAELRLSVETLRKDPTGECVLRARRWVNYLGNFSERKREASRTDSATRCLCLGEMPILPPQWDLGGISKESTQLR